MMVNDIIPRLQKGSGHLITFHQRKRVEQSFGQLHPQVLTASAYLQSCGIKKGDTVAIVGILSLIHI